MTHLEHPLQARFKSNGTNANGEPYDYEFTRDIVLVTHEGEFGYPRLWATSDEGSLFEPNEKSNFTGYERAGKTHVIPAAPGWYIEGTDETDPWRDPVIAWSYNEDANNPLKAILAPDSDGYWDGPVSVGKTSRFVYQPDLVAESAQPPAKLP